MEINNDQNNSPFSSDQSTLVDQTSDNRDQQNDQKNGPNSSQHWLVVVLVVIVALVGIGFVYFQYSQSDVPSEAKRESAQLRGFGLVENEKFDTWKIYRNEEYGIEFQYPSSFTIETDEVHQTHSSDEVADWYRVRITNEGAEEKPSMLLEINADGYGPFFPDKTYDLSKTENNTLELRSVDEYDHENTNDGRGWIIARFQDANNGHNYSWHFSFDEVDKDWEPTFQKILSTFRLMPVQEVSSMSYDKNRVEKPNWGVAFLKPENWNITSNNDERITIQQQSDAARGDSITITYITGEQITSSDNKFGTRTYYFDENTDQWMQTGTPSDYDGSSVDGPATVIMEADGLPVFRGKDRWLTYIIPLSHNEFLELNIGGSGNTKPLKDLVKTIQQL